MNCRHCATPLTQVFADLNTAPPSNNYLTEEDLAKPEVYFPLRILVCDSCWLVQTEDYANASELFRSDYAYFSSVSESWLAHARKYACMIVSRLGLGAQSFVVEVASNDGYLLRNFRETGIPCLGIEPTASTAKAAEALGIPVRREFFGKVLADKLAAERKADLIIGNNVYAHVPDINDFTSGLKALLAPNGTITLEFPHLKQLIDLSQFDTIYHEHFSYLSLIAVENIFRRHGLAIVDVEKLPTHGGSLRVYGAHVEQGRVPSPAVRQILDEEIAAGLTRPAIYATFQAKIDRVRDEVRDFLVGCKKSGKTVVAYGAAAKGNTLLNFVGIKRDLLPVVYDAAPSKQYKYLPGSRIQVEPAAQLRKRNVDYVIIIPWNIKAEIVHVLKSLALPPETKIVTFIPNLVIT